MEGRVHARRIETHPINAVMLYLSMRSEVETDGLLDYLLTHDKIVLAPVTNVKQLTLTPHHISNLKSAFARHRYGMREPNRETCPAFPRRSGARKREICRRQGRILVDGSGNAPT